MMPGAQRDSILLLPPPSTPSPKGRARPLRGPSLWLLVLLAVVVADLAFGWRQIGQVWRGELSDPDSYMLLVRMREALSQGHWFGGMVSRDASGHGVVLYWSHLFDAMILLLYAPLRLVLPLDGALYWAGAAMAPLSMGLLGIIVMWAPAPLALPQWRWAGLLFTIIAESAWDGYGNFGYVTHHVLLIATVAATIGFSGRAAVGDTTAGLGAGTAAALGIWLSPETVPFCLLALGAIGVGWAAALDRTGTAMAACGSALAVLVGLGFALDPPYDGYGVIELDRLSIVFVLLAVILCASAWCLRGAQHWLKTASSRMLALLLAVGGSAATWLTLFPELLRGLGGIVTKSQGAAFFSHIEEMQPVATLGGVSLHLLDPALATLAAAVFAAKARGTPGSRRAMALWTYCSVCGVAVIAIGVWHVRFTGYAKLGAALMLPIILSRIAPSKPLLRPLVLAVFLLLPPLPYQLGLLSPTEAERVHERKTSTLCSVRLLAPALSSYAGKVVLANVNDTPELLWRSPVLTVGSLYHSGIEAFMRLRAAWRAGDLNHVPAALRQAGVQYLLICPGERRSAVVAEAAGTLWDRVHAGNPPSWLTKLDIGAGSGFILYRVNPQNQ
jgi:hypothetical protein